MQSSVGCLSSDASEVCCQISLIPYNDWKFQAIKVRQPSTVMVLRYRIYEKLLRGWKNTVDQEIDIPMNGGIAKFELNTEHNIEIIAGKLFVLLSKCSKYFAE